VKERVLHYSWQELLGDKVILWHIYEKTRFKIDGQEDVSNNQLETLWPYKEERHNVINLLAPELFFFLILAHLYIKCE